MAMYGHLETNPRRGADGRPTRHVRPGVFLGKIFNPITVAPRPEVRPPRAWAEER